MSKIYKIIFLSFVFLGSFVFFGTARAATLSLSSASQLYSAGQTFSVNVYVSTPSQAMNAASGTVSFSSSTLQVVSISKVGSVFSLWVQEPSFSNTSGTVSFEGIVLNPGFIGSQGKIMTITFRARGAGQSNLTFSSGSVLANDGSGSNILTNSHGISFTVGAKPAVTPLPEEEVEKEEIVSSGEEAPVITSSTHPDQAKWYSNKTPEFSWNLPSGALEVRTLIGTSPSSIPTIRYSPPIGNKKTNPLEDGTYYFHLQIRTDRGWGEVAHYRVNIDTTAPEPFSITFPNGVSGLNPEPTILFNTTDILSLVSHYDIKIGGDVYEPANSIAASAPYILPSQYPGTYTLVVTAVDGAGNRTNASADFTIEALDTPIITLYSKEVTKGEFLKIGGTTYQDAEVSISIKTKDGDEVSLETVQTNDTGEFYLITRSDLSPGVYTISARVTNKAGARSNETYPYSFVVQPKLLAQFTSFLLDYFSAILLITFALACIIGLAIYLWYRLVRITNQLKRQNKEVESLLKKAFTVLRTDIDKHIAKLKSIKTKRELTTEEIAFLEKFEKNITESEAILVNGLQSAPKKKKSKPTPKALDQ